MTFDTTTTHVEQGQAVLPRVLVGLLHHDLAEDGPLWEDENFVNHLCVRGQIRCVKGYNDVSQHRSFSPGSGLFEVETIPSKRKDAPLEKVRDGAAQRPQVLFLPVPEEGALRHKGDPPNRQIDEPVVMIS